MQTLHLLNEFGLLADHLDPAVSRSKDPKDSRLALLTLEPRDPAVIQKIESNFP